MEALADVVDEPVVKQDDSMATENFHSAINDSKMLID